MDPVVSKTSTEQFNQIHIDVVRNATDDFNLFRDSQQWSRIFQNPFQGPIALGFQIVSNAKNFLCGSRVDQRMFFDELQNRYQFPEIFPCSFISCALLEKSMLLKLSLNVLPWCMVLIKSVLIVPFSPPSKVMIDCIF